MKKAANTRPLGHVLVPMAAIGSLSILLATGFLLLGITDRLDGLVLKMVCHGKEAAFPKALPEWSEWLAAVICGFALPFAMLGVAGVWRRWVLWISTLFLIVSWAPVLALAAHAPAVGTPLIVVAWAGFCALVYASGHRMPCESDPEN